MFEKVPCGQFRLSQARSWRQSHTVCVGERVINVKIIQNKNVYSSSCPVLMSLHCLAGSRVTISGPPESFINIAGSPSATMESADEETPLIHHLRPQVNSLTLSCFHGNLVKQQQLPNISFRTRLNKSAVELWSIRKINLTFSWKHRIYSLSSQKQEYMQLNQSHQLCSWYYHSV